MPKYFTLFVLFAVLVTACAPAAQSTAIPTQPPPEPTVAQSEALPTPTQESAALPPTEAVAAVPPTIPAEQSAVIAEAAAYNGPAWATLPLVDARSGQTFTLADFAGKTVFVEPMATWCTNCRAQIPKAEAARASLNPDQYIFIGLSVGENVDNATLAQYVNDQGWNFTFAVASETFTQGVVDTFGRTIVTPPSTPHFIIRPDGSLTDINTGSHTTEELVAQLQAASGA